MILRGTSCRSAVRTAAVGLAVVLLAGAGCTESSRTESSRTEPSRAVASSADRAGAAGADPANAVDSRAASSDSPSEAKNPHWAEVQGVRVLVAHFGPPDPHADSQRLPMVVAVHGLGSRPEQFISLFRQLAGHGGRRLVVPAGFDPFGRGYSWFPLEGQAPDPDAGMAASADRLATVIRALTERFPTEGRPKITGFSQGGAMSFLVAIRHPTLISGAYPMGGWVPPALWPSAPGVDAEWPPVVAFHGKADERVPVERARATVDALNGAGFSAVLNEEVDVGHTVSPSIQSALIDLLSHDEQ